MTLRKKVRLILECPCFRTPFESQSVHGNQTVLKPALQRFYLNFPLIYDKMSWKTSLQIRKIKTVCYHVDWQSHVFSS